MFARTPRLTLRPGWPEDAATLTETIAHEAVAMTLSRMAWPYAVGDAEAFLAVPRGPADARFLILAHESRDPRMVGGIGLNALGAGRFELGYWLTPSAWGRGYATEAGRVVIEMARHALPVRQIEAKYHLGNDASRRVLAKLGFAEVRREPAFSLAQGREVECAVMALDLDDDAQVEAIAA